MDWTKQITKALHAANEAVQSGWQEKVAELDLWAVNHVNEAIDKFSGKAQESYDRTVSDLQKEAKQKINQAGKGAKQQLRHTSKKLEHLARSTWKNIGKQNIGKK